MPTDPPTTHDTATKAAGDPAESPATEAFVAGQAPGTEADLAGGPAERSTTEETTGVVRGTTGEGDGSVSAAGHRLPSTLWVRVLVVGAAVLAILLLGAAIGMVTKLPGGSDANTSAPAAESVDVGFSYDMTVHHRQAVNMANWVRDHSEDPEILQLAFDIEQTQLGQIGRMEGWLSLWGYPEDRPVGKPFMTWMPISDMADMPGMSHTSTGMSAMPGMAGNDDLTKLRTLTGKDLDVYFLQLMLRHHQGGGAMARYTADHAAQPAVRALAANMLSAQASEITQMKTDLATRGAQPLPN